jgi:hypothetical protein
VTFDGCRSDANPVGTLGIEDTVTVLRSLSICISIVLATATVWALESPAREFSADIVSRDRSGAAMATVARLYAARGKVRIEPAELAGGFFLIDREAPATLLVRPAQRVYMNARQSSPLTQIFIPVDVADPCRQWHSAMEDANAGKGTEHWRCALFKEIEMGGRRTVEFRTSSADDAVDERFIDAQLQFPLKVIAVGGSMLMLENIQITPQQAGLFRLPRDYRLFDPRALVERIKRSDVWVDPPSP